MPLFKFEVQADYEQAVKLREEILRLQQVLVSMPAGSPVASIKIVEGELAKEPRIARPRLWPVQASDMCVHVLCQRPRPH